MKRVALVVLFACTALAATEKWWDAYNRGVAAVNGGSYDLAAKLLQKAIAEQPTESTSIRAGQSIITYVPHFWLGIAKLNLGDPDGALREWKICEEQGAIARTAYYAKMKEWMAKAQREQQRAAHSAVDGPRKSAEAAISRAMQIQGDALSAGADRTQRYREAQQKLQAALTQFRKAGNDGAAYASVAHTAEQAAQLFSAAADDGKKIRAANAARPKPKAAPATPVIVGTPPPSSAPVNVVEPAPVISQAKVVAEVAVQEFRRKAPRAEADRARRALDRATTDAEYDEVRLAVEKRLAELAQPIEHAPAAMAVPKTTKVDLGPAYRAYAKGDLLRAERLLTAVIGQTPAAEAFLLRGCVRHTQAMLSGDADALLVSANEDFKAALRRNRALRLDPGTFSPKLIARLEQVRSSR